MKEPEIVFQAATDMIDGTFRVYEIIKNSLTDTFSLITSSNKSVEWTLIKVFKTKSSAINYFNKEFAI